VGEPAFARRGRGGGQPRARLGASRRGRAPRHALTLSLVVFVTTFASFALLGPRGLTLVERAWSFGKVVTEAKAKIKDLDTLKATFPAIGKECGGCHETYRVKNG